MAEYRQTQYGVPYLHYENEGEEQVHRETKPIGYSDRPVNTDVLTTMGAERQQFNDAGGFTELEQLGFESVATTPEAQQKWYEMVYNNPEITKKTLADFGQLEADRRNAALKKDVMLPTNLIDENGNGLNFTMQDLEDSWAMVNKLTGNSPTLAEAQEYVNAVKQHTGQDVEIQEINGQYIPFVLDVNKNKVPIQPGISSTIGAYIPDMIMTGLLDIGVGAGMALSPTPAKGAGTSRLLSGAGKLLSRIPGGKIALASAATSGIATGLDAYTNGQISNTLQKMTTVFGENEARKKMTDQIISTIGYPEGTQRTVEDAIIGGVVPVAFSSLVKLENKAKGLYQGYKNTKNAAIDSVNKVDTNELYGTKNWIKKAWHDATTLRPSTKEKEILAPLAKEVYDTQLYAKSVGDNFSIANARKALELQGINTEKLSDTDVLYHLVATDKMASSVYLNHIVSNHSVAQVDALRQAGQANRFAFKAALDHVKNNINTNTNLSDFVTNFKEVPKQIDKLIENQLKNYRFGKVELDQELLNLAKWLYNIKPNMQHSIFEGSLDYSKKAQLGSDLRRSIDLASRVDKNQIMLGDINVDDAFKMIVEIENKSDAVIKRAAGKLTQDKLNELSIKLQSAIIDTMYCGNKDLDRLAVSEEVYDVLNNLRDAMNFKNDYKSLHKYFADHGKKLSEFLVGNNRETNLRLITEDLIKNAGELPDLDTLARMFSKDPFGKPTTSKQELETFMVKNVLDKGLSKDAADTWKVAEDQLDWFVKNKGLFQTQEGKLVATVAEQLLKGLDVAAIQSNLKQGKPVKFASTDARLSTSTLKATAVILNDKRMKFLGKLLGGAVKTDAYMVDYMSTKLAKAIVKPLDISSGKSVTTYLDIGVQRGYFSIEMAHKLAEEFGALIKLAMQQQKLQNAVLTNGEQAVQQQFGAGQLTPEQFNDYINTLEPEVMETYLHSL